MTAHLPKGQTEKLDWLTDQFVRPRRWLAKESVEAYAGLPAGDDAGRSRAVEELSSDQVVGDAELEA